MGSQDPSTVGSKLMVSLVFICFDTGRVAKKKLKQIAVQLKPVRWTNLRMSSLPDDLSSWGQGQAQHLKEISAVYV